ncbi:MAG: hypothetical protein WBN04_19860, partial [Paracoccaceae bacterium]
AGQEHPPEDPPDLFGRREDPHRLGGPSWRGKHLGAVSPRGHLGDRIAATLPYTDERRVAIGRALMGKPDFILLDEPAAGMSGPEAADLSGLIRRIAAEMGCGVLLIEHNVGLVLGLCDHIVVLDSGATIETGPPAVIRASETVRHAYMGTAADTDLPVLEVAP